MLRKILFILLFAGLHLLSMGESRSYLRKISWFLAPTQDAPSQKTEIPSFYGAIYPDNGNIPWFSTLIEVPEGREVNGVKLEQPSYKPCNSIIESPLPAAITLTYHIEKIRKKRYIHLLLPAIKKGASAGKALLLSTFVIDISFSPGQKSLQASDAWQHHSVLSSGKWVKVGIKESGIYKISYNELTSWGLTDPSHPRIFGNGGKMIPEYNNIAQPDDLEEVPVRLLKGSDETFNQGDYLLFYAQGITQWHYDSISSMLLHQTHLYSDSVYYFITSGPVKDIAEAVSPPEPANVISDSWDDVRSHEENLDNPIKSGKEWYEPVPVTQPTTFTFEFHSRITSEMVKLAVRYVCRSATTAIFSTSINGDPAGNLSILPVNTDSYTSDFAHAGKATYALPVAGTSVEYGLTLQTGDAISSQAWIDYVDVNVRRALVYDGTPYIFRDITSTGTGKVTTFHIETTLQDVHIWDVTGFPEVAEMPLEVSVGSVTFKTHTDSLKQFIIFSGDDFPSVGVKQASVSNQDLHGTPASDMIIITYPGFLHEAETLADLHRQRDGLRVLVATTTQVYNEFSSGIPDPGAIRNFVKMLYDRASSDADLPKYLLLFGDGSYDNLSRHTGNTNLVPTWQSQNSLSPTQSFVSDDFFGLLDDNEGGSEGFLDIGIGRLPANTVEDAETMINKISQYLQPDARGVWRNSISFIGDDEDDNIHMQDANILATYVNTNYPAFNIDKIYLDAWPQETTPGGDRYPDVNQAINNRVQQGCLIVNYVGHGNERGLAHENILGIDDINSWDNLPRLPLFVTATCEFSRFDDIDRTVGGEITPKTSAGEWVLLNPEGGGIALLSTTRLVYSSPNFVLNQNFYKYIFASQPEGKPNTLGDALRLTKNASGTGNNKRNFTLLGDPALVLAYPRYRVVTDSLNHVETALSQDTLKALDLVEVAGHLEDKEGNILSGVHGQVYPVIYDKSRTVTTLGNDGGAVMSFEVQDNILFKGESSLDNGRFHFSFRIPKDIDYNPGYGKIGYYAAFDTLDAAGSYNDIIIGSYTPQTGTDNSGPVIQLFMNDTLFINGGITGPDPVLLARISDSSGVNTVGNGIGHDLVAVLDGDEVQPIILNNYFSYALNSYQQGEVYYPLYGLLPGMHEIRVKAWDNMNNSNESVLNFKVTTEEGKIVTLINYPNPFIHETSFRFTHTFASDVLDITIKIYTSEGNLVRILHSDFSSTGFCSPPLHYDGKDNNGQNIGAGIYFYRIIVRSENGSEGSATGKMIKLK